MASGMVRLGKEVDDQSGSPMHGVWRFVHEELCFSTEGVYPKISKGFVENIQHRLEHRPQKTPPGSKISNNNVKISFSSVRCPEVLPTESVRSEVTWKMQLPFFDYTSPSAAETALNHICAGTMARTLSQVGGHPVDTVKTRMQIQDPPKMLRKWRQKISSHAIGIGPLGIDNWFLKGPADLYRGVMGAILGTVPNALLYFAVYESSKQKLEKCLPPGLVHVASASMGTIAASIVRVPADTLKHRVQAYMHSNVFEAYQSVVMAEGLGGLYRGFWPTLMRDVPEIAIQFSVYEKMRSMVQAKRKVSKLTTPEHLLLGACAGAIAATCTMPLDLVKTRQQCGVPQGIIRIAMTVVKEKGATGLFTGLGARAFHVSLMSSLFFGLFEYCKLIIKPDRTAYDRLYLPKIWNKRRAKIWKRQFIYTD